MFNKKVKKLVLGSLMVVMAASLVGGCGSSSTITSNKKLIVGTNATFVPFEFKDDKTQDYAGFDIDLIRAIGKRINKDSNSIHSLDDLKNKKIAAQMGTTGSDLAHKIEGTSVKEFDHSNEALLELQNGGVDATVIDLPVAQYYSTKHPDEHIQILPYPNTKEYLGLALNKDNKALQEEINKAIADMKADGEFNTLYKKWFNVDAPADMPVVLDFK